MFRCRISSGGEVICRGFSVAASERRSINKKSGTRNMQVTRKKRKVGGRFTELGDLFFGFNITANTSRETRRQAM